MTIDAERLTLERRQAILKFLAQPFFSISYPDGQPEDAVIERYNEALTQDTYAKEQTDRGIPCRHYQRLEFLGDRILNHAIAEFLFQQYPSADEGFLSEKVKFAENSNLEHIVSTRIMDAASIIRLGKGQQLVDSILANVFEAILGAIYLDPSHGIDKVREIVITQLADAIHDFEDDDPISRLQKLVQQHCKGNISEILDYVKQSHELQPNNEHLFTMEVQILGIPWGSGQGAKKQEARQEAARAALRRIDDGDVPWA